AGRGRVRRAEDAMGEVVRAVRRRDVVADHPALAGGRGPRRAHAAGDDLWRAPSAATIPGRGEADAEGGAALGIEVIGQTELGRGAGGRLVDREAGDEVIDAARDPVDRDAGDRGPRRAGCVE